MKSSTILLYTFIMKIRRRSKRRRVLERTQPQLTSPSRKTSQPDCFHYKKDQYQRGSFCDYWHHGGRSAFLCTHSAVGDEKKKRSGITNIAVNTEVTQELSCVLKENRGYKFTIRPILQQVGVQPTRGHFEFRCWQHC